MKAICVDDERLLMEDTLEMCRGIDGISEAHGFTKAEAALAFARENRVDIALLDIDMPGMNGLELAAELKAIRPDTEIIFLTGYSEFAVDAFRLHASGYLLKPVSEEALAGEVAYALSGRRNRLSGHIVVRTFGNFDVFVEGRPVAFKAAKCRELLAYLVDKRGTAVTRAELSAALWEDRLYDRSQQKQIDVYIRRLRDTLREYGIEEIFENEKGQLRVRPERFICDVYLFFEGNADAVNAYNGQYMETYSWASMTESAMYWRRR
ncbi:MAG: response regulator [Clostridiales bacterium]|nr:response regulator [Clostridiales bacterium]